MYLWVNYCAVFCVFMRERVGCVWVFVCLFVFVCNCVYVFVCAFKWVYVCVWLYVCLCIERKDYISRWRR